MNKDLIFICLEEAMFDQENKDLVHEGKLSTGIATLKLLTPGVGKAVAKTVAVGGTVATPLVIAAQDAENNRVKQNKDNLKTAGVGVAAAGGAYLLYKGIKALYNKYKEAKTPEAKAVIKSQIETKKSQLQKAKKKG